MATSAVASASGYIASVSNKNKSPASRQSRDRPERQQDPRLVAARVDGKVSGPIDVKPGDWIVAVSPVRMDDGRVVHFHPPQPVTFNLIEAKRHLDRGARKRRSIMGNLRKVDANGGFRPSNSHAVLDCLSDLTSAVLHSFTAIECLANHSIEQLDDTAEVRIERHGVEVTIPRDEMIRRLSTEEKLDHAVPLLPHGHTTKGTAERERFYHLKRLRDDLVHVKARGYSSDPDDPSAYGKLMLGAGDECVQEAIGLALKARPDVFPAHVRAALDITGD